ncbi:hypothetical protein [Chroococcidiopsis sp. CCNUC1]|uniref:hypothetical protein n=1 Tax=Chroococcidiopsis sp. CCNUC1 TaxID=2653189 RepID=UPI0020210368|nr:hypothetical protein [Chroococcidiopsis sp. CCNUC1]URD50445.1 hypothetical protein M5J74_00260 [Chroococcidiopsis sp. CCNUC1]
MARYCNKSFAIVRSPSIANLSVFLFYMNKTLYNYFFYSWISSEITIKKGIYLVSCQLTVNHQPATNYQLPITNYQLPIT